MKKNLNVVSICDCAYCGFAKINEKGQWVCFRNLAKERVLSNRVMTFLPIPNWCPMVKLPPIIDERYAEALRKFRNRAKKS